MFVNAHELYGMCEGETTALEVTSTPPTKQQSGYARLAHVSSVLQGRTKSPYVSETGEQKSCFLPLYRVELMEILRGKRPRRAPGQIMIST